MEKNPFVNLASIDEIPEGKMKHAEIDGNEILVANTDGKIYALCDRCSHTNAPLSMGNLKDNVVTCPMHGARFDIKTGKKISDPTMPSINMDSLPSNLQKYMQHAGQILSRIRTYDQKKYEVKIEGNSVKVKV
ncbi:MAG TPA: non-heme iron oxygenase ferredoxin subunit [Nitrososphaeraceae archaeon]|jgi:3-phenylpropionate/trans-cinnamate dioxygenase ferredoxin subunit|nr:non-heme iron oxygenase ferredoxin subunit [Nitrososphaeraceae archaeon]